MGLVNPYSTVRVAWTDIAVAPSSPGCENGQCTDRAREADDRRAALAPRAPCFDPVSLRRPPAAETASKSISRHRLVQQPHIHK